MRINILGGNLCFNTGVILRIWERNVSTDLVMNNDSNMCKRILLYSSTDISDGLAHEDGGDF